MLQVFLDLCSKFKPAMKYFFFENFPSAGVYVERRLAYARSAATSSMIGYILGLGKNLANMSSIESFSGLLRPVSRIQKRVECQKRWNFLEL